MWRGTAMAGEEDNFDEKQREEDARAEADVAKLTADLDDLKQTLLRRQADFDNYRKRIEKERLEESKRATARVVEALIPIVDGFEHALAAHREAEYESYRKGFELIYKQMLENLAKLEWSGLILWDSNSIRISTRRLTVPSRRTRKMEPCCKFSRQDICTTGVY